MLFFFSRKRKYHQIWLRLVNTLTPLIKTFNSYYQMIKIIVNLGSKKCENNDTSNFQITGLQNSLLMSIVKTPEKDLSNIDRKYDTRKVNTSSIKLSWTFFPCSIRAIYNRFNRDIKVSCWSHIFLGLIHWYFQRDITKIYFLKN